MEQQEERIVSFFRFEDLRVYAKATDFATWVTMNLPATEAEGQKALTASFCHSAFDIALNIAEGSSRSKSQFDHYLKIAKTAIRECVVYTEVAHNMNIFGEEQYNHSRELLMELTRMLGALIISLQRSAERNGRREEEESSDPYANEEMSY
ncbi:MAG: four helix bundle protein [Bacteroidales bacterium]|jgi:four helix bundle protein|nr:four helix bundle protein [Bacteroidales bacterium]